MYPNAAAELPRFATLPEITVPRSKSWLSNFCMTPFRDVDDRVARMAAGKLAEKAAREAAMSAVPSRV